MREALIFLYGLDEGQNLTKDNLEKYAAQIKSPLYSLHLFNEYEKNLDDSITETVKRVQQNKGKGLCDCCLIY